MHIILSTLLSTYLYTIKRKIQTNFHNFTSETPIARHTSNWKLVQFLVAWIALRHVNQPSIFIRINQHSNLWHQSCPLQIEWKLHFMRAPPFISTSPSRCVSSEGGVCDTRFWFFKRVNTADAITLNLPFFLISYYTVKGIDSKFIWQTLKMQKTFLWY